MRAQTVIEVANPDERAAALTLVLGAATQASSRSLIEETLAKAERDPSICGQLLVARTEGKLAGAIWSQPQAGGSAHLWPPQIVHGVAVELRQDLLRAALDRLAHEVQLVQALLPQNSGDDARLLRGGGFEHISDLLYLVSLRAAFPDNEPLRTKLIFQPYSEDLQSQLAHIIEQTYEGTRDCPGLNGVRSIDDVLAGYRATGRYDSQNWLIVRSGSADDAAIGCVLLAEHAAGTWELIYMGVVPMARGRGLGVELTRHAQWHVGRAGGERLVLAVDAANEPAIAIYAAAGFTAWDRRSVLLKINPSS